MPHSTTEAIIHLPGRSPAITLAGQPLGFLSTKQHSRHVSMFEWTIPARFSTGLHVHRVQEETFYVLAGACEWQVGEQVFNAAPGAYLFLPPGVAHDIRNPHDEPAKLLMTVSPPGHEHYFEELARLIAESGRPDAASIAELRQRYDTEQLTTLTR